MMLVSSQCEWGEGVGDGKRVTSLPILILSYLTFCAENLLNVGRIYRMQHTRKDTREHTMSDQFRYVLVTSDPMISLQ